MNISIKRNDLWENRLVTLNAGELKFRGLSHFKVFALKTISIENGTIYFAKKRGGTARIGVMATFYNPTEYILFKVNEKGFSTIVYTGEFGKNYRDGMKEMIETYLPILKN